MRNMSGSDLRCDSYTIKNYGAPEELIVDFGCPLGLDKVDPDMGTVVT